MTGARSWLVRAAATWVAGAEAVFAVLAIVGSLFGALWSLGLVVRAVAGLPASMGGDVVGAATLALLLAPWVMARRGPAAR
jgi:hypothetical protein